MQTYTFRHEFANSLQISIELKKNLLLRTLLLILFCLFLNLTQQKLNKQLYVMCLHLQMFNGYHKCTLALNTDSGIMLWSLAWNLGDCMTNCITWRLSNLYQDNLIGVAVDEVMSHFMCPAAHCVYCLWLIALIGLSVSVVQGSNVFISWEARCFSQWDHSLDLWHVKLTSRQKIERLYEHKLVKFNHTNVYVFISTDRRLDNWYILNCQCSH